MVAEARVVDRLSASCPFSVLSLTATAIRFAGASGGPGGFLEMTSNASKSNLTVLEIPVTEEEDDIGLTPLTRPGTPLIIGTKPRLRPHEILVPPPTGKDFQTQWRLSPSSPDLLDRNIFTPRTLTRSNTVPRPLATADTTKFEETMIEDLVFEPEKLVRLRRWILTIVVGALSLRSSKTGSWIAL